MGDLAVPSLENAVANGSLEAIDDLSLTDTPNAIEALARMLWQKDSRIASRAAWRLSELLTKKKLKKNFDA